MVAKTQALAVIQPNEYALVQADQGEIREILSENLGGGSFDPFSLDRISVPAGGGLSWTVPTIEGPVTEPAIDGVIVYWRDGRQYWQTSFDEAGGGAPPDCFSLDGFTGTGTPGGDCRTCRYAQFGSSGRAGSQAQACRATRMLLVIRPADVLPVVVTVPPSSLKALKGYFLQLTRVGLPYYGVVTRLGLEQDKSGAGIKYSKVAPLMLARLTAEQAAIMRAYNAELRPAIDGAGVRIVQPGPAPIPSDVAFDADGNLVRVDPATGEVLEVIDPAPAA